MSRTSLSTGDAIVVVALLAAALIWNAMWFWAFETAEPGSMEEISSSSAVFLVAPVAEGALDQHAPTVATLSVHPEAEVLASDGFA